MDKNPPSPEPGSRGWRSSEDQPGTGPLIESYSQPDSGLSRYEGWALGTLNVLLLQGDEQAAQAAFDCLNAIEQRLSKFLPESDVSLLNSLGSSRPVTVGGELLELIRRSREAWELTGGVFDPTIGSLMRAWGLVDMVARTPDSNELSRLLESRGMDLVEIDPETQAVSFSRPEVSLDLGAIGKGYAADRISSLLEEKGVETGAMLSGRSTVLTWGLPPGEKTWQVEVCHPGNRDEALCRLSMQPGALSSSSAAERFLRAKGKTYGHILDPRDGLPTETIEGATIWTRQAALGDILSTTLFILGRDALGEGGCVEQLVKAWTPPGEEPRASIILAEKDSRSWGGIGWETFYIGEPGFVHSG
ncbi:MAG: FAD:protein FMN transferase [Planctomycetota bacterium]|nr:hypothetical protein [Planctomycetota bacterium]MEE3053651.1 FAD:protein FMN transferase [Planctomycetota bacterium]